MYPGNPYLCNTFNPINTAPQLDLSALLEDKLISIRNSNTIFSTMVCPGCGERLVFGACSDGLMACCPNDDYETLITTMGLITLLNNNGLNRLVTPPKPTKALEETKESVPPPPDGFKVEPLEDD